MSLKVAIFDLDGVLVNTVPLHFKAWKKMFNEYGKEFNFEDYKQKVDGIPRLDGARAILTGIPNDELEDAAAKKQGYYLEIIKQEGVEAYQTSADLIKELREHGIKIAVISSSRNCHLILEKAGLVKLIDIEVSGNDITKGKPDPQIFLMVLERLGIKASEGIVFEDAVLGVEAACRANIFTVGIDRHKDPKSLSMADLIVEDLSEVNFNKLSQILSQ